MVAECATPGCTNTAGHGLLRIWCRGHADTLAAIRGQLHADEHADYRIRGLQPATPVDTAGFTGGAW
jgi:hypothetical protein